MYYPSKRSLKIISEVIPLPGITNLAQAFDSSDSNVTEQEAAILQHVEDLKISLCGLNPIDHTRQQELKDRLDCLVNNYKSSHVTMNRISRLAKVQETLESLEGLREQLNMSVQTYTIDSIGVHSEKLKNINNEIQSVKSEAEERVSKNEAQISSVLDMLKSLKELLSQAAERITNLMEPSFPQPCHHSPEVEEEMEGCCYFYDIQHCEHAWGKAYRRDCRDQGHESNKADFLAKNFPEHHAVAVRNGLHTGKRPEPSGFRRSKYLKTVPVYLNRYDMTSPTPAKVRSPVPDTSCTNPARNFNIPDFFSEHIRGIRTGRRGH